MSDAEKTKKKTRLNKFTRFLIFKVPLILIVLFILFILSLKLLERYPEPLRQGFEDFLSKGYSANASIGKLNAIRFFPAINIDAEDITMHDRQNAARVKMEIESLKLSAPFWSMFLNNGQLYGVDIKNVTADAGVIAPYKLAINKIEIIEKDGPEQYGAFVVADGQYQDQDFTFEAELVKLKNKYKLPNDVLFSLSLRGAEINALMVKKFKTVDLNNVVLTIDGQSSPAQDFVIYQGQEFMQDNPLYCVIHAEKITDCNKYLKQE